MELTKQQSKIILVSAILLILGWLIFSNTLLLTLLEWYPVLIIPVLVIVLVIVIIVIKIVNQKGRTPLEEQQFWMDRQEKMKATGFAVSPSFQLVDGEKIIFPMVPSYIEMNTAVHWEHETKDVIVTNKRILIGQNVLGLSERFGQINLWHPKLDKLPDLAGPSFSRMYQYMQIKSMEFQAKREGIDICDSVKVLAGSSRSFSYTIYHPNAKEIYDIFSK